MIDKGACNKGYAWNTNNCDCECDKSCDFGEYLDYKNCKCRKRLVDTLVEECNENIDEAKFTEIALKTLKRAWMLLHGFYCLGCNCLNNLHGDQYLFCLL